MYERCLVVVREARGVKTRRASLQYAQITAVSIDDSTKLHAKILLLLTLIKSYLFTDKN